MLEYRNRNDAVVSQVEWDILNTVVERSDSPAVRTILIEFVKRLHNIVLKQLGLEGHVIQSTCAQFQQIDTLLNITNPNVHPPFKEETGPFTVSNVLLNVARVMLSRNGRSRPW